MISDQLPNPLIYIQTPDLASGHTLTKFPNPLIFNQAANLQSAYNLSAKNIGMQNSISDNRTLGVTDSYSQTLCVSFSDAVNLRSSLSGVQKEKDNTTNTTLWDDGSFHHKLNQSVNRKANLLYFELQQLKNLPSLRGAVRLPSLRGLVSKHTDCNSPFEGIGISSIPNIFPSAATITISVTVDLNSVNNIHLVSYCSGDVNHRAYCRLVQPRGSMPRDCNSLRNMRFIHVAKDESPSTFACSSSCCLNSSVILIWYCGDLFSFGIDMVITLGYFELHGNDHCSFSHQIIQRPVVLVTHTGRLTKPLNEVTIMATPQLNQTRLKFTFLIASGTQRLVDIHPVRLITVLADSEGEARLLAGISSLIFVSRQPRDIGIDTPFNYSDMSTVQGMSHA
ncbi:hypothetical protein [Photorhabdus sp. S14-60]|nr:hypothetical protein [Photorhabdus sp. S14-60]